MEPTFDANTIAQLSANSLLDAEDLQKMKFYATTNFHIWLIRAACYFCCARVGVGYGSFRNGCRAGVAGSVIENWLRTSNICSRVFIYFRQRRQSYPRTQHHFVRNCWMRLGTAYARASRQQSCVQRTHTKKLTTIDKTYLRAAFCQRYAPQ